MTQAQKYVRATDFSDEELANVGGRSTVRTAAVDAELDAVGVSLNRAIVNQVLNQRDDGEIRDGRVKLFTLASDVLALLTQYGAVPRGVWLTTTLYAVKDLVTQGGNTYIAVTLHTSGVFATDLAAGKWILFSLSATPSASSVTFTSTTNLSSTNTQAAIEETDTENRALSAAALAAANAVSSNLANTASLAMGDALVGVKDPFDNSTATTQHEVNSRTVSLMAWAGLFVGNDITAALDAACSYCNQEAAGYIANPPDFFKLARAKLVVPRGDWVYSGTGVVSNYWMCEIEGAGKGATRIQITTNVYLLNAVTGVGYFGFRGIHTYGGKGIFAPTFTAANTLSQQVVEDNIFMNYTECAIGHLSQDWPHWKIKRNQFHGALSAGERMSFGVVLSGRADGCEIEGNEFQENKVDIKLAVSTFGTVAGIVSKNVFERWTTSPGSIPSTNLWIVPTTAAPTVSGGAGVGTLVTHNRFGNENLLATDYHILIADENTGAGTSALNYLPAISASTKHLGGVRFKDNTVYGTGATSLAAIYSTTPNVWACEFDNTTSGTPIAQLTILPGAVTDAENIQYATNKFRQPHVGGPSFFMPAPASVYMGPVEDPISLFQSWNSVPAYWRTGYDAAAVELTTQFVASYTLGTASLSNVTDAAGGNEAVEMTASALNGFMATATSALTQGRMGFVSFDIKAGSSLPLPYIRVAFTDNTGTNNPIVDRLVGVNTQWRRVTIPFCMNAASSVNTLQFQATAYAAGVNTKVQIGRVRVYHAQEAVHPYTKTLDSGLVSYTIGAVLAGQTVTPGNVTVTGAAPGDFCLAVYGATLNGMIVTTEVISANTVKVYVYNPSGGTITPAVNGIRIRVFKAV